MSAFATVEDIETLYRQLTSDEEARAGALLPLVSDELRVYAQKVDKDLDVMAAEFEPYANLLKVTTCDIVYRAMRQNLMGDTMTQESQSGLGYSWSGTPAVPGGGIAGAILYNDLKRLGLMTQKIGATMLWSAEQISNS